MTCIASLQKVGPGKHPNAGNHDGPHYKLVPDRAALINQ